MDDPLLPYARQLILRCNSCITTRSAPSSILPSLVDLSPAPHDSCLAFFHDGEFHAIHCLNKNFQRAWLILFALFQWLEDRACSNSLGHSRYLLLERMRDGMPISCWNYRSWRMERQQRREHLRSIVTQSHSFSREREMEGADYLLLCHKGRDEYLLSGAASGVTTPRRFEWYR